MSNIKKYKKKPVVIDAIELIPENHEEAMNWCPALYYHESGDFGSSYVVETLEGQMIGTIGDFLIRGVNGEYYPCKPDIFEKTYEEVI